MNQYIVDQKHSNDHVDHNTNTDEEAKYPGLSRKQRVRQRADQLFHEGEANKATKRQEALQNKQGKKAETQQRSIDDRSSKRAKMGHESSQEQ
eukprot:11401666-Heterocapsa_arctica.AAC.1